MIRSILAVALAGTLLAAPVAAGNEQLRLNIKHKLNSFDPKIDVDALTDQQVTELFLVLNGTRLTFLERQAKIRAVLY